MTTFMEDRYLTNNPDSNDEPKNMEIGVHVGNMLMYAAGTYDSVEKTVLEGVQNAIDARAKTVLVGFDLKNGISAIADDGEGVSIEKFRGGLASIGQTQKARKRDALGKFGLGLVSPLDKCEYFEFVSRPGRSKPVHAWIFAQAKIKQCKDNPTIDMVRLDNGMPTLEDSFEAESCRIGGNWNTIVRMRKITRDKTVNRLTIASLRENIRSRFGEAMRLRKTVCHLFIIDEQGKEFRDAVHPVEYTGEPIEGSPFVISRKDGGDAGKITIELYRAVQTSGRRKGMIKVSEGVGAVYGIPLSKFVAQAKADLGYDTKDSFEELTSGYFEGLIRAENLALNIRRDGFEANDAMLNFVLALDDWYKKIGKEFYEGERDRARDDRYRDLTKKALDEVRNALAGNAFDNFLQGVRDHVDLGFTGEGHGEKPSEGQSDDKMIRSKRKPISQPAPGGKASSNIKRKDPDEGNTRDSDTPLGQIDPKGRNRAKVRDDSIGLWVEVTEFELSTDLWRFDTMSGKLMFNCSNDVWADLDGASSDTRHKYQDTWIIHLQKWVITQVLMMLQLPAEKHDDFAEQSRRGARLFAEMCIKPLKLTPKS